MSKKVSITILLSAMIISAIIIIASVSSSVEKRKMRAQEEVTRTVTETTPIEIGYYLKEYQGDIAVFRGTSQTPFRFLGVNLNLLSDYDKVLLHDGIFVQTIKELNALIEDYTS